MTICTPMGCLNYPGPVGKIVVLGAGNRVRQAAEAQFLETREELGVMLAAKDMLIEKTGLSGAPAVLGRNTARCSTSSSACPMEVAT